MAFISSGVSRLTNAESATRGEANARQYGVITADHTKQTKVSGVIPLNKRLHLWYRLMTILPARCYRRAPMRRSVRRTPPECLITSFKSIRAVALLLGSRTSAMLSSMPSSATK